MRTREIQIGLRHLLARSVPPPRPAAPPPPAAAPRSRDGPETGAVPAPVARLICGVRTPSARRQMQRLVADAELDRRVQVGTPTAARMVRPYSWLLERIGTGGIRLTDAGHLPPTQVRVAADELGLPAGGPGRRESQVEPVRQLRESAQAVGLLRRQRGQLLPTARGAELRSDPAGLWWHLAERMPLRAAGSGEIEPGLILLVCVAAGSTGTLNETIGRMLTAIGWMNTDGSPLTGGQAVQATHSTRAVLRLLGALPAGADSSPGIGPSPEGTAFARAALRAWPAGGAGPAGG